MLLSLGLSVVQSAAFIYVAILGVVVNEWLRSNSYD